MTAVEPGHIITLAIGILVGVAMQGKSPCSRPCCAPRQDPGLPPTKTHTSLAAPVAKPNPAAHNHLDGDHGRCCAEARAEAAAMRGPC